MPGFYFLPQDLLGNRSEKDFFGLCFLGLGSPDGQVYFYDILFLRHDFTKLKYQKRKKSPKKLLLCSLFHVTLHDKNQTFMTYEETKQVHRLHADRATLVEFANSILAYASQTNQKALQNMAGRALDKLICKSLYLNQTRVTNYSR
jgi:hypothetical protein